MAQEKLLNQLWVFSGASYTFNVCTTAATDSYRGWVSMVELYDFLMSLADKRVADWPLMTSPWPTLVIICLYLYLVYAGPRLMSNRKPLELRPLLLLYNATVAGLNLYIGLELTFTSQKLDFSWTCEPVDYTLNPLAVRVASALWWYYASKLLEMFDTVFFILRKKNNQLTFLHVYHHSTMFGLWWIGVKYVAGGSSFLGAMFNCYVHVLMYTYYFLAAIGPWTRPFLWWKKYLTMIQMVQFFLALIFGINALRVGCDFPMWMQYSANAYMVSFLVLFGKYFYREYCAKQRKKAN